MPDKSRPRCATSSAAGARRWTSSTRAGRAAGRTTTSSRIPLNRAAQEPPLPVGLDPSGAPAPLRGTAAAAVATLARDAVDLLGGPLGHRVRVCAADDCELLFVDTSRPGSRRWCSMERSGTLAKVRAHRARG